MQDLRARKFDMAILLQNAFEAAALVWLAGHPADASDTAATAVDSC